MSLGLNDLKKRRPAKSDGAGAVSENWGRGTTTTRPWSNSNLSKGPRARKARIETSEAAMNQEWVDDYTSTHPVFNMEAQSALTQLQDLKLSLEERARDVERKIKRAAMGPFEIMRSVLQMVQK